MTIWNIKGKTVLITGATSGLGKATAVKLAKLGADIIFTSRDMEKALALVKEIGNAKMLECDLASLDSVRAIAKEVANIDVLINNAGVDATVTPRIKGRNRTQLVCELHCSRPSDRVAFEAHDSRQNNQRHLAELS